MILRPHLVKRVLKIDSLTLTDHYYLDANDVCYYAGEYTAGENHAYSETNQLIHNFKKTLDKKNTPQWQYKELAILKVAQLFNEAIKSDATITFVPVPPSKAKNDPLYDDRLTRTLSKAFTGPNMDIRELIVQSGSTVASHLSDRRPTPDELIENYHIDTSLINPTPRTIFIVDDVLTTGCHFKAVKRKLQEIYPDANFGGLFIARRVPKSVDFDLDIDFL
jgi:hypothetical protein